MVLVLLECLVNHTAEFTGMKSEEEAALQPGQTNLFSAVGYPKYF
jgi:hypothetical protein